MTSVPLRARSRAATSVRAGTAVAAGAAAVVVADAAVLARLDRLKIIELQANNRIRPLISRAFTWLPQGPIQTFFYAQAQADFFRSRFDGEGEALVFASGRLSKGAAMQLTERLKRTVQEFREAHIEDLRLPMAQRPTMSVLVAMRQWEFGALRALRRKPK